MTDSYSVDTDLSKVRSFEKRQELYNILHSDGPDHYSRVYLAGFLGYVGYSLEEICSIIDAEASWSDYDAKTTWCQVRSVLKRQSSSASFLNGFARGCGGELLQKLPPVVANEPYCSRVYTPCAKCLFPCRLRGVA